MICNPINTNIEDKLGKKIVAPVSNYTNTKQQAFRQNQNRQITLTHKSHQVNIALFYNATKFRNKTYIRPITTVVLRAITSIQH